MAQAKVNPTPGELRTEAFLFGMLGSLAAGLFVWFLQNQFKTGTVMRQEPNYSEWTVSKN